MTTRQIPLDMPEKALLAEKLTGRPCSRLMQRHRNRKVIGETVPVQSAAGAAEPARARIITSVDHRRKSLNTHTHVWPLQHRHILHITPQGVYFVNRTMPAFILPDPVET